MVCSWFKQGYSQGALLPQSAGVPGPCRGCSPMTATACSPGRPTHLLVLPEAAHILVVALHSAAQRGGQGNGHQVASGIADVLQKRCCCCNSHPPLEPAPAQLQRSKATAQGR